MGREKPKKQINRLQQLKKHEECVNKLLEGNDDIQKANEECMHLLKYARFKPDYKLLY